MEGLPDYHQFNTAQAQKTFQAGFEEKTGAQVRHVLPHPVVQVAHQVPQGQLPSQPQSPLYQQNVYPAGTYAAAVGAEQTAAQQAQWAHAQQQQAQAQAQAQVQAQGQPRQHALPTQVISHTHSPYQFGEDPMYNTPSPNAAAAQAQAVLPASTLSASTTSTPDEVANQMQGKRAPLPLLTQTSVVVSANAPVAPLPVSPISSTDEVAARLLSNIQTAKMHAPTSLELVMGMVLRDAEHLAEVVRQGAVGVMTSPHSSTKSESGSGEDASAPVQAAAPVRPCDHNTWDNVRARKGAVTLRCRTCQSQWRVLLQSVRRCPHFDTGRCNKAGQCAKLHVFRSKQSLNQRVQSFGDQVLNRVPAHVRPSVDGREAKEAENEAEISTVARDCTPTHP